MPEHDHLGEKTEQPTPRRLEEALKKGQIARSAEVQTAFVLLGGVGALMFSGQELWGHLVGATVISGMPVAESERSRPDRRSD